MKASTTILLVSALPSVFAWGNLGHETIAYIAQNFGQYPALPRSCVTNIKIVSTATKTYFQNILGDTSTSYLANHATWVSTAVRLFPITDCSGGHLQIYECWRIL